MAKKISFDTLAYAKTLQDAGFSQEQSEGFTRAQNDALDEIVATRELATKADINQLDNSIAQLEASTKADISRLENSIAQLEASTKADISRLETSTKADIALLQKEIADARAQFPALENRLIKWMLGLIIALGAFLSALMLGLSGKLFH